MSKKWVVVLSDGTTWELVSPGIRVYEVEEGEVGELDLPAVVKRQEGVFLTDLLSDEAGIEALVAAYRRDPSTPYSMSIPQIRAMLAKVGEEEPLLDALAVAEGLPDEERAELLGVSVEDVRWWRS